MASKRVFFHRIPKYERLQRMSERYPSLDPDAAEAHIALKVVGDAVAAAMRKDLARHGISEGRFLVLALLLEQEPRSLTHSDLADLSGVTKGNITGLVDGLERDGFVRREGDRTDRRVSIISLTSAGKQLIEDVLPGHFARVAAIMAGLSASDRKSLVELLMKVRSGLTALE